MGIKKINIKYKNIIILFVLLILSISIVSVEFQNDTFYSISIGNDILKTGVDMQDHYSWHKGLSYTYPHWFFDVIVASTYNIGGFTGLYMLTILFTYILTTTVYILLKKICSNSIISLLITTLTMLSICYGIAMRAQIITYILFLLEIYAIEGFLNNKKKIYVAILLLIPIVIANMHIAVWYMYFILYLPYIGEYLCSFLTIKNMKIREMRKAEKELNKLINSNGNFEDIEKQKRIINHCKEVIKEKENIESYKIDINQNKITKKLIIIMIIAVFSGLLVPNKMSVYTYFIKTLTGISTHYIQEHQPIVIANASWFITSTLIIIVLMSFTKVKIKLSDMFLVSGLAFMSILSIRSSILFSLLSSFVIARLFSNFLKIFFKENEKRLKDINLKTLEKSIFIILILFIYIKLVGTIYYNKDQKFVNEKLYPVEAANFIEKELLDKNIRLYNEYETGSYLVYRRIPVFIDTRADLYLKEFNNVTIFEDGLKAEILEKNYYEVFEKYNITHALISKSEKLYTFMSKDKNLKEIYSDENFVIYIVIR